MITPLRARGDNSTKGGRVGMITPLRTSLGVKGWFRKG